MVEESQNKTMTTEALLKALRPFIAMRSVAGDAEGNRDAVACLRRKLTAIGFDVSVAGADEIEQPVIMAHRAASGGTGKLLIYGHYDVVPAGDYDVWQSKDPFVPEIMAGRIYARGIADNKGTLLIRILALSELVEDGAELPEICWLIHGSEEAPSPCAVTRKIIAQQLGTYRADLYLEETGFNDIANGESILLLWRPSSNPVASSEAKKLLKLTGCDRVEQRHLNKANGGQDCPFLQALPADATYVGFGPNDRHHRIHTNDESLDLFRLSEHYLKFKNFIRDYAST